MLVFEKIYSSSAFDSMHELLQTFVNDAGYYRATSPLRFLFSVTFAARTPAAVLCAAIGIVGPVVDERFMYIRRATLATSASMWPYLP